MFVIIITSHTQINTCVFNGKRYANSESWKLAKCIQCSCTVSSVFYVGCYQSATKRLYLYSLTHSLSLSLSLSLPPSLQDGQVECGAVPNCPPAADAWPEIKTQIRKFVPWMTIHMLLYLILSARPCLYTCLITHHNVHQQPTALSGYIVHNIWYTTFSFVCTETID